MYRFHGKWIADGELSPLGGSPDPEKNRSLQNLQTHYEGIFLPGNETIARIAVLQFVERKKDMPDQFV